VLIVFRPDLKLDYVPTVVTLAPDPPRTRVLARLHIEIAAVLIGVALVYLSEFF
jgi:hypothetical protein